MERLTYRRSPDNAVCIKYMNSHNTPMKVQEAANRLAAYEDTGLEPEAFNEEAVLKLAAQALGTTPERLRELAKAQDEGRVVVLPCKVGDTVFVTTQVFNGKDTVWMIGSRKIDKIEGNALNPIWMTSTKPYEMRFHPSEFGKTWFLDPAEAEAALGGGGDG